MTLSSDLPTPKTFRRREAFASVIVVVNVLRIGENVGDDDNVAYEIP